MRLFANKATMSLTITLLLAACDNHDDEIHSQTYPNKQPTLEQISGIWDSTDPNNAGSDKSYIEFTGTNEVIKHAYYEQREGRIDCYNSSADSQIKQLETGTFIYQFENVDENGNIRFEERIKYEMDMPSANKLTLRVSNYSLDSVYRNRHYYITYHYEDDKTEAHVIYSSDAGFSTVKYEHIDDQWTLIDKNIHEAHRVLDDEEYPFAMMSTNNIYGGRVTLDRLQAGDENLSPKC